jgi:hypothetical protein
MKKVFGAAIFLFAILIWANPLPASVKVVVAIDGSTDMQLVDEKKLGESAVKFFIDLCEPGDTVSIVEFCGSYTSLPFTLNINSSVDKERLAGILGLIRGDGAYSDPNMALSAALSEFSASDSGKYSKLAVLIVTDGELGFSPGDPHYSSREIYDAMITNPPPDEALRIKAKLRQNGLAYFNDIILPELAERDISVFVLVPGRAPDAAPLAQLCIDTGGNAYFSEDPEKLIPSVADIYAKMTGLKISKHPLRGFSGVRQKDIKTHKGADAVTFFYPIGEQDELFRLRIYTPLDTEIDPANPPVTVKFFEDNFFNVVRIEQPPAGVWRFMVHGKSPGGLPIYRLEVFNFELSVSVDEDASLKKPTTVKASFQRQGEIVGSVALQTAKVEGEYYPADFPEASESFMLRDDGGSPDEIAGDGIFSAAITPGQIGVHLVQLEANSPLFSRKSGLAEFHVNPIVSLRFSSSFLNLGTRRHGDRFPVEVNASDSKIDAPVKLNLSLQDPLGMEIEGVLVETKEVTLTPDKKAFEFQIKLSRSAPDGVLSGNLLLTPVGAKPGTDPYSFPFSLIIKPRSFFEKHIFWIGPLVILLIVFLAVMSRRLRRLGREIN